MLSADWCQQNGCKWLVHAGRYLRLISAYSKQDLCMMHDCCKAVVCKQHAEIMRQALRQNCSCSSALKGAYPRKVVQGRAGQGRIE